jgi:hypothetical protein
MSVWRVDLNCSNESVPAKADNNDGARVVWTCLAGQSLTAFGPSWLPAPPSQTLPVPSLSFLLEHVGHFHKGLIPSVQLLIARQRRFSGLLIFPSL